MASHILQRDGLILTLKIEFMKQFSTFILFFIITIFIQSKVNGQSPSGIIFSKLSWEEVKKEAKEKNKPIFIDVTATWCGPCKWMKKETYTDIVVGEYFNENFINVSLDGELSIGAGIMNKYNLNAFPSLLFIDSEGRVLQKKIGSMLPNQLLKTGKKAVKRHKKEKNKN